MTIVTRFAPSPTGFLHIGGARTALFNWLFAKHTGGTFLLRIEDTDRARSTQAAVDAILAGLQWLGLDWDGDAISQFERRERHAQVAHELVDKGMAYRCFASQDELEVMRTEQKEKGLPLRYDGRWRDRSPSEAPAGVEPVIRLKAPTEGETVIDDAVQGRVTVANAQLDDMVLLRSDGTPTYMLSVVVDDHDMGVTHVIRGDDHLTNAFRQTQLYRACGWDVPVFAHIPLIHGPDGAKLSKRHGAQGVEEYRDMGYLPDALRNYLLRLGWSHGDDEIISTEQAIAWFELSGIGRSPSRLDFTKLDNLNGHYLRASDDAYLTELVTAGKSLTPAQVARVRAGMNGLKQRAKTVVELASAMGVYTQERPLAFDDKARAALTDDAKSLLRDLHAAFASLPSFEASQLEETTRTFAEARGVKLGAVAQPLRAALTGTSVSPPVFEVAGVLGRDETLARLADVAGI
ncbi:glutamate--tRNA ligase [Roseiterribacter gracilis]|uniref:Glutamate--tRNA ligase n=1 Tax=Roseiterribacter gracilis TaxID=2812848 RepID=A0A8S8X693_9PROT|nr:glutamate--tRNA ligase 2 [Rhodospirillales bacterium TMPK1]